MNPLAIKLSDDDAERVRRSHHEALTELQRLLPRVISNIELKDGTATNVAHGCNRAPRFVGVSALRGAPASAGYVVETRPSGVDRSKTVVLQANGYGAPITVDLLVVP